MAGTGASWNVAILLLVMVAGCGIAGNGQRDGAEWNTQRKRMVEEQLRARDISSARVLDAMLAVPRHLFVPESVRPESYGDTPLPIGHGQTISQPYIVAFMTQALEVGPEHRVLEIGTGSGYQAAVLSVLAREVFTWRTARGKRSPRSATATSRSARGMAISGGRKRRRSIGSW
jgi:hypothetical protein